MRVYRLEKFIGGWMVGDFEPTIIKTKKFEFSVKKYKKGEIGKAHYHKKTEELTVVIKGRFKMNKKILKESDVVFLKKNEVADFKCLASGYTAVIKIPSIKNDKYII